MFDDVFKKESIQKPIIPISTDIFNRATIIKNSEGLHKKHFEIGVFGLGFEERCLESIKRISSSCSFSEIILVEYPEEGKTSDIKKCFSKDQTIKTISFENLEDIIHGIDSRTSVLLDITGLYKPIIFEVIRRTLINRKSITVVYTEAREYYPLNSDIRPLLEDNDSFDDDASKFINLMKGLTTGETNEYTQIPLIKDETHDIIRPTVLAGFVSPKNQRIFSILDRTEYEAVSLFVPAGETERDVLSRTAGNIAATNYSSVELKKFNTTDTNQVLVELSNLYEKYYVDNDFNFELALTGSKMQAVAAAVFSSICRVSQCWYVKPKRFDIAHFTKGVGETSSYLITIDS